MEKRSELSACFKTILKEFPPLAERSSYHGEAAFWLQIHQGLLRTSAILPSWCEQALSEERADRLFLMAPRISDLANQLVSHAHTHHHIEDDHFFPVFLANFPSLGQPLDLLEKDHEILSVILDDIQRAMEKLRSAASQTGISSGDHKDILLRSIEALHPAASRLDRLFIRHINDEEEICLPTLMQLQ